MSKLLFVGPGNARAMTMSLPAEGVPRRLWRNRNFNVVLSGLGYVTVVSVTVLGLVFWALCGTSVRPVS